MTIGPGNYTTQNGTRASIYIKKAGYWIGTVENGGITEWREDGIERWGCTEWNLVKKGYEKPRNE